MPKPPSTAYKKVRSKKRYTQGYGLHEGFRQVMTSLDRDQLATIIWDLMCVSPWFDETSAIQNPLDVAKTAIVNAGVKAKTPFVQGVLAAARHHSGIDDAPPEPKE